MRSPPFAELSMLCRELAAAFYPTIILAALT